MRGRRGRSRGGGREEIRYHAGSFVDDERQLFAFLLFSFLPVPAAARAALDSGSKI